MPLLYEKRGAVAVLILSRPQARNAWGEDYNDGLKELLPRIEDDAEVRCVVLTGDEAGGAFSAGLRRSRQAWCASFLSSVSSSAMKR